MTTEKLKKPVPEEQSGIVNAEDTLQSAPASKQAEKEKVAAKPKVKKAAAKTEEKPKVAKPRKTAAAVSEESTPEVKAAKPKTTIKKVTKVTSKKDESLEIKQDKDVSVEIQNDTSEKTTPQNNKVAKETLKEAQVPDTESNTAKGNVDFSEEEIDLAANAPEFELGEEDESERMEDSQEEGGNSGQTGGVNYNEMTKAELVTVFGELLETRPVQSLRKDLEAIKVAFYKNHRADLEGWRKSFVESGGNPEEFVPPVDENEVRLKELFAEYRCKRDVYLETLEEEKENNYKVKLQIIEELKELINSNETLNHTFNAFRTLQNRWKETGPVPQGYVKDLWETYNLHVENFYNVIKINKELRDLDLKKNYEIKLQLCEEAESLMLDPSIVNAFHKLQKLHEAWRETGPVANEYKEQLWERFREASSQINKRHQDHFEGLKDEQKRNLELKTELCIKTEELADASFDSRKEWNKASEQLIEIQKVWKTIGFAPKKDNTRIYERFRNACDRFFENKRKFYLQAKGEMDTNLQLKIEICGIAESIKESDDWKKTTDELISLQQRWKEIGPVSRRHSDMIWKRFRKACDHFFERKSSHFSQVDTQYEENLAKKRALLEELRIFEITDRNQGFENIKNLQRRWSEIGFVPIKEKDAIQTEYRKLVDVIFGKLRGNERDRNIERFRGKISGMKEGGADRKVRHERDRLYNKLKQIESDIALLENNIGFFAKSKNAEAMIRDVNTKIEKLKEEMTMLIEKINMIDNQAQ